MIRLTCTNCEAKLKIDEAFAGGVCRCQHCGTIQTVPNPRRGKSDASGGGSQTLFHKVRAEQSGTGLDELGDVVSSSGLRGGRLREQPDDDDDDAASRDRRFWLTTLSAGLALCVVIIVLLVMVLLRPSPASHETSTGAPVEAAVTPAGPSFCGVGLDGQTVIYVIDRGSGTAEAFGLVIRATLQSVRSLGSGRKFQIVMWERDGDVAAEPAGGVVFATPDNVDRADIALADVYAFGQTDIKAAVRRAMREDPDLLVIATGKSWDLDADFTRDVLEIASGVKIHAISIGDEAGGPLRAVAEATGGEHQHVSLARLRELTQPR